MDNSEEQLDLFSFAEAREEREQEKKAEREPERETEAVPSIAPTRAPAQVPPPDQLTHADFQQLCIGFLASLGPHAIAASVPVRRYRYPVGAAGFWRGENGRTREVARTAVVVLVDRPDNCFCECVDQKAMLDAIHAMRGEKERIEAEIRINEPELASKDDLFGEFRSWDYTSSKNTAYRRLRNKLEKLQHSLYQGSRLERIRRAAVADLCYLAVPAGLVAPDEIEEGWGLVYLNADRSFTLLRDAELQDNVEPRGRRLLATNIAVAATNATLFMAGIDRVDEEIRFRRPPRRRQLR